MYEDVGISFNNTQKGNAHSMMLKLLDAAACFPSFRAVMYGKKVKHGTAPGRKQHLASGSAQQRHINV
jgi:hypothetical protein